MKSGMIALLLALPLAAQTLTLREALDQAAELNPTVQAAKLRILESKADADTVSSRLQPQVGVNIGSTYATNNLAGIGLAFPGIPGRVGPYRVFNARPSVTQTVFDLSLVNEARAAREKTRVVEHQQKATREETLLAVLQTYLQALEGESRVTAANARLKTAEALLAQTRELENAGAASKLDIARAEQQLEQERTRQITAQKDRDVLVALLVETIGMDANPTNVKLATPPEVDLDGPVNTTLAGAFESRTELKAAEAQTRAAELEQSAARRERLPKLQAFGDYGALGQGPDQSLSTFAVGASVTLPLWTGKRIESRITAAAARIGQAEQELRKAKLQIAREVQQAAIEIEATRQAVGAAEKATAAARTSLELARLRFAAGLATNIDTIVAQGRLAEAEDEQIRFRYQHQLARARMARAAGDVYGFLQ